ncbi:MAG TPA: hypothetical protein VEI02_15090 [Planctomycetota bacterium]|nr:hypothetical protein [Planctomycetota bacterium]
MSYFRRCAPAVAVALLCAAPAQCTILIKQDLKDLTAGAKAVVRAKVLSKTAGWDAERRFIWTTYELAVVDVWKGDVGPRLVLKELGGETGTTGMRVAGAPEYAVGQDVVTFLHVDPLGNWRTLGWTQGKAVVAPDAERPGSHVVITGHPHVFDALPKDEVRAPGLATLAGLRAKVVALAKAEAK